MHRVGNQTVSPDDRCVNISKMCVGRGKRVLGDPVWFGLVFWVMGVSSCASLGRGSFQQPTLSLQEVEIAGIGLTGGTLNLMVDVYNPNAFEIRTSRLRADVMFEDTRFGQAVLNDALRLPPRSNTIVEIALRFSWEGVGAGARSMLTKGAVVYTLDGTLMAEIASGEREVRLRTGGTVGLRDLMRGEHDRDVVRVPVGPDVLRRHPFTF